MNSFLQTPAGKTSAVVIHQILMQVLTDRLSHIKPLAKSEASRPYLSLPIPGHNLLEVLVCLIPHHLIRGIEGDTMDSGDLRW